MASNRCYCHPDLADPGCAKHGVPMSLVYADAIAYALAPVSRLKTLVSNTGLDQEPEILDR